MTLSNNVNLLNIHKQISMSVLKNISSQCVGGKKWNIFTTYLPTGQIVESERGNKHYFNSGLAYVSLSKDMLL